MIGTVFGSIGEPVVIRGMSGDYDKAIARMEFSLDEGRTWTSYDMPGTTSDRNVSWSIAYTPERAGRYRMLVRAVNVEGQASPVPADVEFVVG